MSIILNIAFIIVDNNNNYYCYNNNNCYKSKFQIRKKEICASSRNYIHSLTNLFIHSLTH